ncbi:hypothetical protein O9929_18630 [Vibrio lentus]|nr:hypothetical protein [Vibrio lentus]
MSRKYSDGFRQTKVTTRYTSIGTLMQPTAVGGDGETDTIS